MKKKTLSQNIGIMAMFIAIGLILQYIENQLPIISVPGGKLGLANTITLLNLFMFGGGNTLVIAIIRATLGSLLSGGVTSIFYSVSGVFFSTIAMWLTKKWLYPKVSMIGLSIIGAAVHNTAQVFVAAFMFSTWYVFSYLPGLLVFSVFCGIATGYCTELLIKRVFKGDILLCGK